MDLENPKTFNEKQNWEKLYYHNPLITQLADKYLVKSFVSERIGPKYVVNNYGVWDSFDEIDFSKLPEKFVLKATHDSGGMSICTNKEHFDLNKAKKRIMNSLRRSYYPKHLEWAYKNAKPRIIADQLLEDGSGHELQDYKVWCFNGVPKVIYLTNKGENIYENFYDMNFLPLDIDHGFPRRQPEYEKPEAFEEMKSLATKLSEGFPFVRVDFFYVDGNIYFGEYTFYDWGGMQPFKRNGWDEKLGSWIVLPQEKLF